MKPRDPGIAPSMVKEHLDYDPETGRFAWKVSDWRRAKLNGGVGHVNSYGYVKIKFAGHHVAAHRLAWLFTYGHWPEGELDHINGNRSDNRIANLRLCTVAQNRINSKANANNRSGLKGAHWNRFRGTWIARCGVNGRSVYIGAFDTAEAAHQAYLDFAARHYGEFSPTRLQQTRIKADEIGARCQEA